MPRAPKYSFEQFYTTRRLLNTLTFAPDGQTIAFVADYTGTFNLYRKGLTEHEPVQLTESTSVRPVAVVWAPDGYIYFLADIDGNELFNLYRVPAVGGDTEPLTNRPNVQYLSLSLSHDGGALYYAGNAITPSETHLFRRDLKTGEERLICGGPGFWEQGYESQNGRFLTICQTFGNTDTRLHLLDTLSGELRELTADKPTARRVAGPWFGKHEAFLYLSDDEGEFTQGYLRILDGDVNRPYITPKWDVSALFGTRDGKSFGFVVNENGYAKVTLVDNETGMFYAGPKDLQAGVIEEVALSADGTKLALLLNQSSRPADIFVWDRTTGAVTRLTDCLGAQLKPADMVSPELVAIPGPDHPIPAWLYRPAGLGPADQVPVLISFHGGPETQELPKWNPLYQYLLDQGIAVLAPNIRGSVGYGKSYQRSIYRDWGGGDLRDMEACAQWSSSQAWVKPGKLAVFGGSYGGFASLSCATRLPQYWACAVDFCGPSDLITFTKTVPPTWRRIMKGWVGDPEEDRDLLVERSPITYIDQVRCPMLVLQGAQDTRVVQAESDKMVEALRARAIPVEYLVFPDEGHGLAKQSNREKGWKAMGDFLLKHLG
ncbi:MAG TPA: S9 family peptidase [Symbiobacteriaceae bacterium]|nr:S9 family peptidase [Symbiobacteriaceae bacterium]